MQALLLLPTEVLEPILEHVLSTEQAMEVWAAEVHLWHKRRRTQHRLVEVKDDSQLNQGKIGLDLLLLRTNTRIALLAQRIFYSSNTFIFHNVHDLEPVLSWLTTIGTNAGYVNNICIIPLPQIQKWTTSRTYGILYDPHLPRRVQYF
ncbi:hypothetical protein BDZ85DRAFT_119946 [Elsinoe ampelina]|uniref:Uncharacterized protein n=1 Tax=Elsinoe ampelina TaxID=302913 RepID=A0A6A6GBK5_9PEZI|nr:hypothetical protein BDZ85DRAFT_119946 [Elsinoe ampelina]